MKLRRWFVTLASAILACVSLVSIAAAIPLLPWGTPVNGLRCRVLPSQSIEGDTPVFEITFQNVSDHELYLFAPQGSFWRFIGVTQDSHDVTRVDYMEDWDIREQMEHFVRLAPQQEWSATLDVGKYWILNFESPTGMGATSLLKAIKVSYTNLRKDGHSVGLQAWTGTVQCQP